MSQIPYQINPATGIQLLDQAITKACPATKFEYATVVFNSVANADTDISHSLDSTDIGYLIVGWNFALAPVTSPVVYRDTSGTARNWQKNYVVLRCNVASASCTLLLFVKR